MSHTDMGIVGATTDTFILFENGVRRNQLALPGLSNAADHMPSKPDPPTALSSSKLGKPPGARPIRHRITSRIGAIRVTFPDEAHDSPCDMIAT
jgi:hypothetical protein